MAVTFVKYFCVPFATVALPGMTSWRPCCREVHTLEPSVRRYAEETTKSLAQKMGIGKPVFVKEIEELGSAQAMGNTILSGKAVVAIDPQFFHTISKGERKFVLAHELSHLRSNDYFSLALICATVCFISFLALSVLFPAWATSFSLWKTFLTLGHENYLEFATTVISCTALILFSRWREACADRLAFSVCSEEGRKGGIELFTRIRRANLGVRNNSQGSYWSQLWRRFRYTAEGNDRLDLAHPFLTSRIRALRSYLDHSAIPAGNFQKRAG